MDLIEQILLLARRYGEAEGVPLVTVSSRAFDDGKRLRALEEGRTITLRRASKVIAWFSDHWPPNTKWPSDVSRPAIEKVAA